MPKVLADQRRRERDRRRRRVLAEVPGAIRRAVALDPRLDLEVLVARAGEVIDTVALVPVDRALLLAAGALAEPSLRAVDSVLLLRARRPPGGPPSHAQNDP